MKHSPLSSNSACVQSKDLHRLILEQLFHSYHLVFCIDAHLTPLDP